MATQKQIKAFEKTLLFHGTSEPFDTVLEPQSHGGCLWVAFSSTVAQSYIPMSGSSMFLHTDKNDQTLVPSKDMVGLYSMLGWAVEAEWDAWGRAQRWKWIGYRPTNNDLNSATGFSG